MEPLGSIAREGQRSLRYSSNTLPQPGSARDQLTRVLALEEDQDQTAIHNDEEVPSTSRSLELEELLQEIHDRDEDEYSPVQDWDDMELDEA